MSKGTIENPRYPDVEAATFTVAADGTGDFTTIAAALAALPAAGGKLFLKQGTYSIAATITLPNKPVKIVGAGIGNTIIDIGSNVIAAFTMASDNDYDFRDFNVVGDGSAGQVAFAHTAVGGVARPVHFTRVNVGYWNGANPIERIIVVTSQNIKFYIKDCVFSIVSTVAAARFLEGPAIPASTVFAECTRVRAWGGGGVSSWGNLILRDCEVNAENGISTMFLEMLGGEIANGGGVVAVSSTSRIIGAVFSGLGVEARLLSLTGTRHLVVGCSFTAFTSEAILVGSTNGVFVGNVSPSLPLVAETGGANGNLYSNNKDFQGSTIIGASSIVTDWNVRLINTSPVTLDETHRTVLVDATGGARVINLPAAATCKYRKYTIKKIDASTNLVTVDPSGAQTIDGQLTLTLSLRYETISIQSDGSNWYAVNDADISTPDVSGEPMGFPASDDTYTTFAWNNGANQLTITPVGTSFDVWVRGIKFTKATTQSVTIVPAEGIWFFYFNTAGTLVGTQVPWDFSTAAPAVVGYYDSTLGDMIFLADERHGLTMDWATHRWAHLTVGMRIDPSGFLISGTLVGDGSLDVHAQVGLGTGTAYDEDLAVPVTDGALGVRFRMPLTLPAQIPVYYRNGATNWRRKVANTFPLLEDGVNRIKYNLLSAGVWSQPNVSANGSYMAVWICATNNYSQPIIAILGQREDTTLQNAQNNNSFAALDLSGLPSQELKVLWRILFQTSTVYANTPHARTRDFLDFRSVSSLPAGSPSVTAHNALTGRDTFPAHPANAIQNFIATVAVNTLLDATYNTVLVDTSGGARTITLPAAASCPGRIYRIKKATADVSSVTIDPDAAETIDGAATFVWNEYLRSVTIQSTGTAWVIV